MSDETRYSTPTRLIHGRMRSESWDYNHHLVPPITASATFRLDSSTRGAQGFQEYAQDEIPDHHIYIYDRLREPNKDLLEENLAAASGGDVAVSYASGMAAIAAAIGILVEQGDHIVMHRTVYGCTHSLVTNWLPRFGIDHSQVDLRDPEVLREVVQPETRVVYFETPVNPTLEIIDIEAVVREVEQINAERDEESRIRIVVDNTFSTPFCQRPLAMGVDLEVHSLTKGLSGFGTAMGGVVIGGREYRNDLLLYRKDFGGVLAPQTAWSVLTYGLPSLAVRMKQSQASARTIAEQLEADDRVARVAYPGLESHPAHELAKRQMLDYDGNFAPGTLLYFELEGETPEARREAGERFINHLADEAYTVTLAVSLGHVRSLVEHPASMTHAPVPVEEQVAMGIEPSGIRLSVGLEQPADILHDLREALDASVGVSA